MAENETESEFAAGRNWPDVLFKGLTLVMAASIPVLLVLIGYELFRSSHLSLEKFGWRFVVSSEWNPVEEKFDALPFIFGTVLSSLIALIIAVPLSLGTALYLTELAPLWIRPPLVLLLNC
jgi:phosphate transport system permease protein